MFSARKIRYLHRQLVNIRSIKLHSFQELNVYLEDFLPDTEGQENEPLPADEIMDIIYHSMPITWKNKMMEQGFNDADSNVK